MSTHPAYSLPADYRGCARQRHNSAFVLMERVRAAAVSAMRPGDMLGVSFETGGSF